MREDVKDEGFGIAGLEPEDSDLCEYRLQKKVKGRWKYAPCGEKPIVVLSVRGPRQPDGTPAVLCRRCLGRMIRDLVGYLEM